MELSDESLCYVFIASLRSGVGPTRNTKKYPIKLEHPLVRGRRIVAPKEAVKKLESI